MLLLLRTLLATSLLVARPVVSWGGLGHRTVAYLAEMYFTPLGAAYVSTVLDDPPHYDISDAAVWPDGSIRWQRPWTKQWHYIDAQDEPPAWCGVQYKRDCNQNGTPGCVVSAIADMTKVVNDPESNAQDPRAQKEALMFLIHFIGDVHQPLHTENMSRGGNDINVCFGSSCHRMNLHSVWDTQIPLKMRGLEGVHEDREQEKAEAKNWAKEIYDKTPKPPDSEEEGKDCTDISTAQDCALAWATEANGWVCDYVLAPGVPWLETHDLAGEYAVGGAHIVESMIWRAGRRLGAWVNKLAVQRAEMEMISMDRKGKEEVLLREQQSQSGRVRFRVMGGAEGTEL